MAKTCGWRKNVYLQEVLHTNLIEKIQRWEFIDLSKLILDKPSTPNCNKITSVLYILFISQHKFSLNICYTVFYLSNECSIRVVDTSLHNGHFRILGTSFKIVCATSTCTAAASRSIKQRMLIALPKQE